MKIGISTDHGGFGLKTTIAELLRRGGHEVVDFGAASLKNDDDYPDFVIPLARALAAGKVERGIAVCGSGVGASVAANKVSGVRAAVVHEVFSAHQGVEDDDMNLLCMGGRVIGAALAADLVERFLSARFTGAERHCRRLQKVKDVERELSR